jgi:hypothetical protein
MEKSEWYMKTTDAIRMLKMELSYKTIKKFQLERLERIVKHIEMNSSNGCDECEGLKTPITSMLFFVRVENQDSIKSYKKELSKLMNHLNKIHQLYTLEDRIVFWLSIGLSVGIGMGIALGAVLGRIYGNMTLLAIGLVLGNGIGMSLGVAVAFLQTEVLKKKNQII